MTNDAVKVTEIDWDNFWKFMQRSDSYQVSLPNHQLFYITFDSQSEKIHYINDRTDQKGEITREQFKQLFGKHKEYIEAYKTTNQSEQFPDEFYAASIIYDYFRWIA